MISQLDHILRELLLKSPELTSDQQVRFQPPDEDWRTRVANLTGNALNVYPADLGTNRKLRCNATVNSFASHRSRPECTR